MELRSDDSEERELDSLQKHRPLFRNGFLRPVSSKHQDWFCENDEEIQGLLEEKYQKHKAYLSDASSVTNKAAYSNICKTVHTKLWDMQDSWLSSKADEIQSFADRKDMKKFFDAPKTVYGLWKSMATFDSPTKFIAMVRQFHDGMLARVQIYGEISDPFPVTNGVKQGCVLSPTLFSMMFSAMLTAAFQDGDNGIPIRYRFDGKFFNLRRLHAKSKVLTEVLDEFLFADDMAKFASTEEKMQKGVDQVSESCDNYDLTVSIKKT